MPILKTEDSEVLDELLTIVDRNAPPKLAQPTPAVMMVGIPPPVPDLDVEEEEEWIEGEEEEKVIGFDEEEAARRIEESKAMLARLGTEESFKSYSLTPTGEDEDKSKVSAFMSAEARRPRVSFRGLKRLKLRRRKAKPRITPETVPTPPPQMRYLHTPPVAAAAAPAAPIVPPRIEPLEDRISKQMYLFLSQRGVNPSIEIRPERCKHPLNSRLSVSDEIVIEKDGELRFNAELMEKYLKKEGINKEDVSLHIQDVLRNPITGKKELFSVTSGDVDKVKFYLSLARALHKWGNGKGMKTIAVHLPYFETWLEKEDEFYHWRADTGEVKPGLITKDNPDLEAALSEDSKRQAMFNTNEMLKYLNEKWVTEEGEPLNVQLALETGPGFMKYNGEPNYALLYEPHYLKSLRAGRDFVTYCVDVAHLNLIKKASIIDYADDGIGIIHFSGNDGELDNHMLPTPNTLKEYDQILSFLRVYSGPVCLEIKQGTLGTREFLLKLEGLLRDLYKLADNGDFTQLKEMEKRLEERGRSILPENFQPDAFEKYQAFTLPA